MNNNYKSANIPIHWISMHTHKYSLTDLNINLMTIFQFIIIISNSHRAASNWELLIFFPFNFGLFQHSKRKIFNLIFFGVFFFIQNRILNSDPLGSDWIESNRIGLDYTLYNSKISVCKSIWFCICWSFDHHISTIRYYCVICRQKKEKFGH